MFLCHLDQDPIFSRVFDTNKRYQGGRFEDYIPIPNVNELDPIPEYAHHLSTRMKTDEATGSRRIETMSLGGAEITSSGGAETTCSRGTVITSSGGTETTSSGETPETERISAVDDAIETKDEAESDNETCYSNCPSLKMSTLLEEALADAVCIKLHWKNS